MAIGEVQPVPYRGDRPFDGCRRMEQVPDVPGPMVVPDGGDTDGGDVGDIGNVLIFQSCRHGHDFVACDGHVICNVCEKVVKVSE